MTNDEKTWHRFFMTGVETGLRLHEKGMNLQGVLMEAEKLWEKAYGKVI